MPKKREIAPALLSLIGTTVLVVVGSVLAGVEENVPTPGLQKLMEAEAEARQVRDIVAPGAYLFRVSYFSGREAERYGFVYANTDGFVSVQRGSNSEIVLSINKVRLDGFAPAPLDLTRIVHAPEDIREATVALAVSPEPADCGEICVFLLLDGDPSESGIWYVAGLFPDPSNPTQIDCAVSDAVSLKEMVCGPDVRKLPVPQPSPPESVAIRNAADVRDTVDTGLSLVRLIEPEADLSALDAYVDSSFEVASHYRLGFSTPDGRTQFRVFHNDVIWGVELVEGRAPESSSFIDVSSLQHGPGEVAEAAAGGPRFRADVRLSKRDGRLHWDVSSETLRDQVTCTLPDSAPFSEIGC